MLGTKQLLTNQVPFVCSTHVPTAPGVVGLACARALAQQGAGVMLLEKAAAFGTETSARHSEGI